MSRRAMVAATMLAVATMLLGAVSADAAPRSRPCKGEARRTKRCRAIRKIVAPAARRAASIGRADGLSSTSGSYSFITGETVVPARWNPCAPVHVVVNLRLAPTNALTDLRGALDRMAAATGLQFVVDGTTDLVPTGSTWTNRQPAGGAWAPVLVGWSTPAESDLLDGGAGTGGPVAIAGDRGPVLVSGQIAIDATQSGDYPAGFGTGGTLGSLLLHELGHVLGLGHTTDERQQMFERVTDKLGEPGDGDLAGLAQLGTAAGGCLAAPPP